MPAADFVVANGPATPQERWENQGGYSPATIASEIAGLVCAADIARDHGDQASADRYLRTADNWHKNVERWTLTTNGPLAEHPYYLRITKDGRPNSGTTYSVGDSGPSAVDQRAVVDTSYLELVRLGVKPANDPYIVQSLDVVDDELGSTTPNGTFWHRYNFDGYGEQPDGSPWDIGFPPCGVSTCTEPQATIGRIWPIFAGERGEYEWPRVARPQAASSRWQRLEARATCSPSRCGTRTRLRALRSRRGRARCRPRRSPGATPSTSGWPGPSTRDTLSSSPPSWPNATPGQRLLPERKSGRGEIPTPCQAGLPTALLG